MPRLPRREFVRARMIEEIDSMMAELPISDKVARAIEGWRDKDQETIDQVYDLCVRSYASRGRV